MNPNELTFTMKDVGWLISQLIVLGVVLWRGGFYVNKIKQNTIDNKNSLSHMKTEHEKEIENLKTEHDKTEKIMYKKFSSVHSAMEKDREGNAKEFGKINDNLSSLNTGMGEVKGMLKILIEKK